ncbi:MAG: HAD family hydrolase [Mycobacterium sp.]
MPVLLDLDNTLVDRDGGFLRWARDAVPSWGGDTADVDWLVDADASGYTPRAQLAQVILGRLNPPVCSSADLIDRLLYDHIEYVECYPGVAAQLDELVALEIPLVIVTNGDSQQQRMKLRHTGLDRVISGVVISGELGFKKPDSRIFEKAVGVIAVADEVVWMVGDHVEADIAGARAVGYSTAWVSHGRAWSQPWRPTLTAGRTADVLALLNGEIRAARCWID